MAELGTVNDLLFSGVWCLKDWCRQLVLMDDALSRIRDENAAKDGDFEEWFTV